jgi:hypothetical protein
LNVEFSSPNARDFYETFVPDLQKWLTKADEPNLILLAETWGRLMDSMRGPAKGRDNFWRNSQQVHGSRVAATQKWPGGAAGPRSLRTLVKVI